MDPVIHAVVSLALLGIGVCAVGTLGCAVWMIVKVRQNRHNEEFRAAMLRAGVRI